MCAFKRLAPSKRPNSPYFVSVATVPAWVTGGWYTNNPEKQRMAITRYRAPVTTEQERADAKAYARQRAAWLAGEGPHPAELL